MDNHQVKYISISLIGAIRQEYNILGSDDFDRIDYIVVKYIIHVIRKRCLQAIVPSMA